MMKKTVVNKLTPIPFDSAGNMVPYPRKDKEHTYVWRTVPLFAATLKFIRKETTSNGARAIFKDVHSGVKYSMSTDEFFFMVERTTIEKGVVTGDFIAIRKGVGATLKFVKDNSKTYV